MPLYLLTLGAVSSVANLDELIKYIQMKVLHRMPYAKDLKRTNLNGSKEPSWLKLEWGNKSGLN